MLPQALYTAFALCALALNVSADPKRSHLQLASQREQKKARDAVWEATRQKSSPHLSPRAANTTSRFFNNASASKNSSFSLSRA